MIEQFENNQQIWNMNGVWVQRNRNVHLFLGTVCEFAGNKSKLKRIKQFSSNKVKFVNPLETWENYKVFSVFRGYLYKCSIGNKLVDLI